MSKIPNISGLNVEMVKGVRMVNYKGKQCFLISKEEEYDREVRMVNYKEKPCSINSKEEEYVRKNILNQGRVMYSKEIYATPIGNVTRVFIVAGSDGNPYVDWKLNTTTS